jgi:hypothetical protein
MKDEPGWKLGRQVFLVSTALALVVAGVALAERLPGLIEGYACGVAVGLLSFGSIIYLVYGVLAPPAVEGSNARRQALGVALQLIKFVLVVAILYVVVVRLKVNFWALLAGLTTPPAVGAVLVLRLPRRRRATPKDSG